MSVARFMFAVRVCKLFGGLVVVRPPSFIGLWVVGNGQCNCPSKVIVSQDFFFFGSPLVVSYEWGTMCISQSISVFKVDWQIHRKKRFFSRRRPHRFLFISDRKVLMPETGTGRT